jgi:hypothetical protein
MPELKLRPPKRQFVKPAGGVEIVIRPQREEKALTAETQRAPRTSEAELVAGGQSDGQPG